MKKRIIAMLLACCLILSAAPVYAGAATGQQVTANAVSVTAGNSVTVTLKAENFENIAALDVYLYYDAAVFTVSSTSNGSMLSSAQASVNTAVAGEITISTMALNGISGSGNLLTVRFSTKSDATPGTYPIQVAIGRAFDGELQATTVSGINGSITVNKPVATETYSISTSVSSSYLQKGDVLTYQLRGSSSRAFVSGEFTVEYDHELFAFESAELVSALTGEGALYSINSAVLGQVRIAYANENPVKSYNLFTLKLKVIDNVDATTTLKASATNMYREDLSAYLPGSTTRSIYLTKLPEVVDYPNAALRTEQLVVGQQSKSVFTLESGCGVSAADFRISYDPTVLRCLAVTKAEAAGDAMVIINDTFDQGLIRFSYVNMSQPAGEAALVEILWEPIASPASHYQTTLSAVGVVDAQQQAVTLEYVTDTGCIFLATVAQEPTRTEEGRMDYICGCGESYSVALPAMPDAVAQVGNKLYNDLAQALAAVPEGGILQLLQDQESLVADRSVTLDLNGCDLKSLTVSDGFQVLLKDTQTDDYTVEDDFGYGRLAWFSGDVTAAEGYLRITEGGYTSAHRVELQITDMVLRPSNVGVYYKSVFYGDQVVARNVDVCGVALSLKGQPTPNDPRSWQAGFASGSATGTLLKGVMKADYSPAENEANAQLEIYGSAYLRTCDGQYLFSRCVQRSLRQQVELIDAQWNDLDAEQRAAILAMYETYESIMNTWSIPNLKAAN